MRIKEKKIPGCLEIDPVLYSDRRGDFIKTYDSNFFAGIGIKDAFVEQYYTTSVKGVLRGMHFQIPPKDYAKLLYCVEGAIMDVIFDLRSGSPTYGQYEIIEISAKIGNLLYLPSGIAHGFYVLSDKAIMLYNVSQLYSPAHDAGIRWDSLDIPWPNKEPILSERDAKLPEFKHFVSPFKFKGQERNEKQ